MKRRKASITVFLSLILMLVLSVVFSFLEAARVCGLEAYAKMDAAQTGNSLLAEYDPALKEKYGILCLDGSYQTDGFQCGLVENRAAFFSDANLSGKPALGSRQWELFPLRLSFMNVSRYELAPDGDGIDFCRQAAEAVRREGGTDLVQELYGLVTQKAEKGTWQQTGVKTVQTAVPGESGPEENPLDAVEAMKARGILALVMGDQKVSAKKADLTAVLSHRSLREGHWEVDKSREWDRKLLFQLYLKKYFSSVRNTKKDRALDYEMEYIIAGKDSDEKNLKAVVNQLLLLREAANVAYLETSGDKNQKLQTAAVLLATAIGQPELTPVMKQSLIAAWAYAESVSDVRLLLEGQCVALVKTDAQWHTDLKNLGSRSRKIKQEKGQDYEDYLQILLWKTSEKTMTYRCMDLIEMNENVKMDNMILQMECFYTYEADPIFVSFCTIGKAPFKKYEFTQNRTVSYQQ